MASDVVVSKVNLRLRGEGWESNAEGEEKEVEVGGEQGSETVDKCLLPRHQSR